MLRMLVGRPISSWIWSVIVKASDGATCDEKSVLTDGEVTVEIGEIDKFRWNETTKTTYTMVKNC